MKVKFTLARSVTVFDSKQQDTRLCVALAGSISKNEPEICTTTRLDHTGDLLALLKPCQSIRRGTLIRDASCGPKARRRNRDDASGDSKYSSQNRTELGCQTNEEGKMCSPLYYREPRRLSSTLRPCRIRIPATCNVVPI